MTANELQIGGEHYKSDYQHWDWCIDINLGYLEGNATKYICRWYDKGGATDLDKAYHYLMKVLESYRDNRYYNHSFHNASSPGIRKEAIRSTDKFIKAQTRFVHVEQRLIQLIAGWKNDEDLNDILRMLSEFIAFAYKEEPVERKGVNQPNPFGYDDEEN